MYVLWLTAGTQRVKNGFEQSQQPTTEVLWLVFLKCALIKSAVVMDWMMEFAVSLTKQPTGVISC